MLKMSTTFDCTRINQKSVILYKDKPKLNYAYNVNSASFDNVTKSYLLFQDKINEFFEKNEEFIKSNPFNYSIPLKGIGYDYNTSTPDLKNESVVDFYQRNKSFKHIIDLFSENINKINKSLIHLNISELAENVHQPLIPKFESLKRLFTQYLGRFFILIKSVRCSCQDETDKQFNIIAMYFQTRKIIRSCYNHTQQTKYALYMKKADVAMSKLKNAARSHTIDVFLSLIHI